MVSPSSSRALASSHSAPARILRAFACGVTALLVASSCGGPKPYIDGGDPGSESPGSGTTAFFIDPSKGGTSSSLRLLEVSWGRLVDVYSNELDFLPDVNNPGLFTKRRTPVLRHRDYLIGENVLSDGVNYLLESNPVTGVTSLTILYDKNLDPDIVAAGHISQAQDDTEAFNYGAALAKLTENLGPVQPKGLNTSELPPFSFVPRNAAVMLRFSDLLDHSKVTSQNVRVLTGYPPSSAFGARILPDPNHGDLTIVPATQLQAGEVQGKPVFRSSRILIDLTVSEVEADAANPPLEPNSQGLPNALTVNLPNVAIALPTELDAAASQFDLLRNISGTTVDMVANGPTVESIQAPPDMAGGGIPIGPVVGRSVVRAFRSGGDEATTGDKNNGFLLDLNAPRILGHQPFTVVGQPSLENPSQIIDPQNPPREYIINFLYKQPLCALTPEVGDALELPGGVVAVVRLASAAPVNGLAVGVPITVLGANPAAIELLAGAQGVLIAPYNAATDLPIRRCFVEITPTPQDGPTTGVSTSSLFKVRFSEPMDIDSVSSFDTFRISRDEEVASLESLVVGRIAASPDLRTFSFQSVLPFDHLPGSAETFFLSLVTGTGGVTDLAGNVVAGNFPPLTFALDADDPVVRSGNLSLRFSGTDEDGDLLAEFAGQFLIDPDKGLLKGRAVTHQTGIADRVANPTVASMTTIAQGIQTPLVPLGSRMMTVWRYCDFQWSATDTSLYNVDVERLYWTPFGGQVFTDVFEQYEIALMHGAQIPDEDVDPNLLPLFWKSGLFGQPSDTFDDNVLADPHNPKVIVHPRELGFVIDPNRLFTNTNGTRMMPWPVNEPSLVAPENRRYFTWRDTATLGSGGKHGGGIDLSIMFKVGAVTTGTKFGQVAPGDGDVNANSQADVPTIGLPLLMEFKCYPAQDTAIGLNSFDVSIALNSSSKPNFRVFSSGGFKQGGGAVVKDPDSQDTASGGFNPTSSNPGAKTPGADPTFYLGQADIVVRVSRAYTHWFPLGQPVDFQQPIVEPDPARQPTGTAVVLQYRGATAVDTAAALLDASVFDAYGDIPGTKDMDGFPLFRRMIDKNLTVKFLTPGDYDWVDALDNLDGSSFLQVRMSFINNAITTLTPTLSALGFAFTRI